MIILQQSNIFYLNTKITTPLADTQIENVKTSLAIASVTGSCDPAETRKIEKKMAPAWRETLRNR